MRARILLKPNPLAALRIGNGCAPIVGHALSDVSLTPRRHPTTTWHQQPFNFKGESL